MSNNVLIFSVYIRWQHDCVLKWESVLGEVCVEMFPEFFEMEICGEASINVLLLFVSEFKELLLGVNSA